MSAGGGTPVLVVEDEQRMRRLLRTSLASHGFRPIEAGTAEQALGAMRKDTPAIIVLDLGLPDADGIELTKQLREWTETPIVVISARGEEEDKVKAFEAGADDYLTKRTIPRRVPRRSNSAGSRSTSTLASSRSAAERST
jgi:two-component system KDP operon response regulator KdpE